MILGGISGLGYGPGNDQAVRETEKGLTNCDFPAGEEGGTPFLTEVEVGFGWPIRKRSR